MPKVTPSQHQRDTSYDMCLEFSSPKSQDAMKPKNKKQTVDSNVSKTLDFLKYPHIPNH